MVVVPSPAAIMKTIGVLRVVLNEIGLDPKTVAKIVKAFVERWRGKGVEIPDEEPSSKPVEREITWEYSTLRLARPRSWKRASPLVPKFRDEKEIPKAETQSLAAYLDKASKDGWRFVSELRGERSAIVIMRRPEPQDSHN